MIDRIERARQFRKSGIAWAKDLTDAEAADVPSLYDGMKYDGSLIKVNTRILWGDTLKRAAVDLWDTEANNPDNNPGLWEDVLYRNGIRVIPENIPATDPFNMDELGWWGEELYKSLANNNVYTPEQYAPNWEKQEV